MKLPPIGKRIIIIYYAHIMINNHGYAFLDVYMFIYIFSTEYRSFLYFGIVNPFHHSNIPFITHYEKLSIHFITYLYIYLFI